MTATTTPVADIVVPDHFNNATQCSPFVLGYMEAERIGVNDAGELNSTDGWSMEPDAALAFRAGARAAGGAGKPQAFSLHHLDYLKRHPVAYGMGWTAGPGASNEFGDRADGGDALAFAVGQEAREKVDISWSTNIAC